MVFMTRRRRKEFQAWLFSFFLDPRHLRRGGSFTRTHHHDDRMIHHEGIYTKTTKHETFPSPLLRKSLIVNRFQFILIFCLWMLVTINKNNDAAQPSVDIVPSFFQKQEQERSSNTNAEQPQEFVGGHPTDEQPGNCYCNGGDNFCMCTPKLAVDIIMVLSPASTSPETLLKKNENIVDDEKFVLLRSLPQKNMEEESQQQHQPSESQMPLRLSLLSDFVPAGGTVEETARQLVQRELQQIRALLFDNNLEDTSEFWTTTVEDGNFPFLLTGVYSDPQRTGGYGTGLSTVSAAFSVPITMPKSEIDKLLELDDEILVGASKTNDHSDELPQYKTVPFQDMNRYVYNADHWTILQDYQRHLYSGSNRDDDDYSRNQRGLARTTYEDSPPVLHSAC